MATVADLIKVLQTLPPETKVKVLAYDTRHNKNVYEDIHLAHGIDGCDHLWFGTLGAGPELHIGQD